MTVEVRELRDGEGLVWRDLRLEALAESPDAFGSTYEASVQRPEGDWEAMVNATAQNPFATSLVAVIDGVPVAMAFCRIDEQDPSVAGLYSMWVMPSWRRRGVARQIVEFALSWMRSRQARIVELAVTEGNEPAIALYTSAGFVDTGRRQPVRPGSTLREIVMRRSLPDAE